MDSIPQIFSRIVSSEFTMRAGDMEEVLKAQPPKELNEQTNTLRPGPIRCNALLQDPISVEKNDKSFPRFP